MATEKKPLLQSVQILRLRPDDVLVVEPEGQISREAAEHLRWQIEQRFPGHKIVITNRVTLSVAREEASTTALFEARRQALDLAGETLSAIGDWFLANADDEHLDSLITPEFKASLIRLTETADTMAEALGYLTEADIAKAEAERGT